MRPTMEDRRNRGLVNEKSKTSGVVVLVASYTEQSALSRMSHQILTAAEGSVLIRRPLPHRVGEWKVRH